MSARDKLTVQQRMDRYASALAALVRRAGGRIDIERDELEAVGDFVMFSGADEDGDVSFYLSDDTKTRN